MIGLLPKIYDKLLAAEIVSSEEYNKYEMEDTINKIIRVDRDFIPAIVSKYDNLEYDYTNIQGSFQVENEHLYIWSTNEFRKRDQAIEAMPPPFGKPKSKDKLEYDPKIDPVVLIYQIDELRVQLDYWKKFSGDVHISDEKTKCHTEYSLQMHMDYIFLSRALALINHHENKEVEK